MIAENLDQNSLADAFRRFPAEADRVRRDNDYRDDGKRHGKEEEEGVKEVEEQSGLDIDDFSDDDDEEEEDDDVGDGEGGDDALDKSSDGMCDDEEECGGGKASRDVKDPDVAHLGESGEFRCDDMSVPHETSPPSSKLRAFLKERSFHLLLTYVILAPPRLRYTSLLDYDSPGTAELVLNRKTYRVGQSYFGINEKTIYAITMILPKKREARCHRYVRMDDGCFVCPAGRGGGDCGFVGLEAPLQEGV